MAITNVGNRPVGSYPVLVDETVGPLKAQMQVVRLDVGVGTAESRVSSSNPLPVNVITGGSAAVPSNSTSTAQEASRIAKASAGTLFVVSGYNNSSSDQFILLFDSATLPANGVVPKIVIMASALSTFGYKAPDAGRAFANGIVICNSSTAVTKTIGSANCLFDIQYS